jgi:hypothetical protein
MLFNRAQTLRALTTSPASTAINQAHRMAQRRLEAGGPAVAARGRVDDGAGKRPAHVPVTTQPPRGFRSVTVDLPEAFVDRLIELGHLRQADREDRNQVLLALYRFFRPKHVWWQASLSLRVWGERR